MEFQMKANLRAFKKLCELQGEWSGTSFDGAKTLNLRYVIASKGSVVIEFYRHHFKNRDMDDEMVTVYHPDGDSLMLTHYCTLGNQPRMVADLEGDYLSTLAFAYQSATNLTHHACLRMSGVTFHFEGENRFRQTWFWHGNKTYIEPDHHSDDYDDLPEEGPGQDTFTLVRVSNALQLPGDSFVPRHAHLT
jgi:hypothetical protein